MLRERFSIDISDFMRYLAAHEGAEGSLPYWDDNEAVGVNVYAGSMDY